MTQVNWSGPFKYYPFDPLPPFHHLYYLVFPWSTKLQDAMYNIFNYFLSNTALILTITVSNRWSCHRCNSLLHNNRTSCSSNNSSCNSNRWFLLSVLGGLIDCFYSYNAFDWLNYCFFFNLEQNNRKRKQHSSSGPANSTGTGNTVGPSVPSSPASTHTPGDGVTTSSSMQHVNNVQKSMMMYGADGTGGLASSTNQLVSSFLLLHIAFNLTMIAITIG